MDTITYGQRVSSSIETLFNSGAVVFILYYLAHESSIPLFSTPFYFMGAYVVQRIFKMFLFGVLKFSESDSFNTDRILYAFSGVLNIAQMIWG